MNRKSYKSYAQIAKEMLYPELKNEIQFLHTLGNQILQITNRLNLLEDQCKKIEKEPAYLQGAIKNIEECRKILDNIYHTKDTYYQEKINCIKKNRQDKKDELMVEEIEKDYFFSK